MKNIRDIIINNNTYKVDDVLTIYIMVNGLYITSYALTHGDTIDYYKESNMLTINNTKAFIHNIRDIEEITSNSINIHVKVLI